MNEKELRNRLVKLAYNNPELRKDILPLVKKARTVSKDKIPRLMEELGEYFYKYDESKYEQDSLYAKQAFFESKMAMREWMRGTEWKKDPMAGSLSDVRQKLKYYEDAFPQTKKEIKEMKDLAATIYKSVEATR